VNRQRAAAPVSPPPVSVRVSTRTEKTKSVTLTGAGIIEVLRKAGHKIPTDQQVLVEVCGISRYGEADMMNGDTTVSVSWKETSESEEDAT